VNLIGGVNLIIDGKEVTAHSGETVLDCALRQDIDIPHLCTHAGLPAFGACRICLVEIEGMRGYPASCSTPAEEGMVVRTDTPRLRELRRNILELMMLEHPSACLVCEEKDLCDKYRPGADKAGRTTGCHTCNNKEVCEVRDLADRLELADLSMEPFYRNLPLERSDPFIDRDLNLCILCGRCVRICKHHHGKATIDFVRRGSETRIGTAFDRALLDADCRFCGSCVDVCPTGSLANRYAKWHGAPNTVTETTCTFCGAACALRIFSDGKRAVEAKALNGDVPICVLGRFALAAFLNGTKRLRVPQMRMGSELREVTWEKALEEAADRLKEYRGETFAFLCDTSSTLEDRHVFRKFTRDVMRSPHCIELDPDEKGRARGTPPDGVRAVYLTGNFVDEAGLDGTELLIVQDGYPTPASERADFVFPAALPAEVDGTVVDDDGAARPIARACAAPGSARPEWRIVSDLACALGSDDFGYESARAVAREAGIAGAPLRADRDEAPPAARDPRMRRTHFRGHPIADTVSGLAYLPLDERG
jgi:predicted molibdopterin-dependent oxidoreductase YjgC